MQEDAGTYILLSLAAAGTIGATAVSLHNRYLFKSREKVNSIVKNLEIDLQNKIGEYFDIESAQKALNICNDYYSQLEKTKFINSEIKQGALNQIKSIRNKYLDAENEIYMFNAIDNLQNFETSKVNNPRELFYEVLATIRDIESLYFAQEFQTRKKDNLLEQLKKNKEVLRDEMILSEYYDYFMNEIRTSKIPDIEYFKSTSIIEMDKLVTKEAKKALKEMHQQLSPYFTGENSSDGVSGRRILKEPVAMQN